MWYLVDLVTNKKTPYFLSNRTYKIGRLNAVDIKNAPLNDIQIASDSTVSRSHAEILIKFDEKNCDDIEYKANIVLTDNSRFGTFVNDIKVEGFITLKKDDIIKFGVNSTCFRVCFEPLIVTSSCISQSVKSTVRKLVTSLQGYLVNDWRNDCSFVIMDEITVTVKCINALLCQRLIITHKYLQDLVEICSDYKISNLDPTDYIPPIGEPDLNSAEICFKPCLKRRTLFKNKIFVFFSQSQTDKLQNIIELAGGKCEIYNDQNLKKTKKNVYLFLNDTSGKHEHTQAKLQINLEKMNQRFIDETEIGLAILYSSIDKHCNSDYILNDSTRNINKLESQTQHLMPDDLMECDDDDADYYPDEKKRKSFDISDTQVDVSFNESKKGVNETRIIIPDSLQPDLDFIPVVVKPKLNSDALNSILFNEKDEDITKLTNKSMPFDCVLKTQEKLIKQTNNDLSNNKSVKENISSISLKSQDKSIKLTNQLIDSPLKSSSKTKTIFASSYKKVKQESTVPLTNISEMETQHEKLPSKIYSKKNPPKESLLIKTQVDEEITSSNLIKIKFENLVKKELKQEFTSTGDTNKVNFKKFRKVPKNLSGSQLTNSKKSLFKSFKNEKLDIETQFSQFMQSIKSQTKK